MEQSPSCEAKRFSVSQEFPRILWKQKVHYHVHRWPPAVRSLSQINPVLVQPRPTSWKSNLILSYHLRLVLPNGLFPSGIPNKTMYTPLPSPILATCPSRLIVLDLITRKILSEGYWVLILTLLFAILKYGFRSPVRKPWNPRQNKLPLRNTIVALGSIWRQTRNRVSQLPFVDDNRLNNGTGTLHYAMIVRHTSLYNDGKAHFIMQWW